MDCGYSSLNDRSSVHPAFRERGDNITQGILRGSYQLVLKGQGNEYRYQCHCKHLFLQTSGENLSQNKDENIEYSSHIQRDYFSSVASKSLENSNHLNLDIKHGTSTNLNTSAHNLIEESRVSNTQKIFGNEPENFVESNSDSEKLDIPDPHQLEMSYRKTYLGEAKCRAVVNVDTNPNNTTTIFVPALDLTSLTMEEETDANPKEPTKPVSKEQHKEDRQQTTVQEVSSGAGGGILFKKQKMPFVFPSERSFNDIDVIRGNSSYSHFDDQYYITSVSSFRTNSGVNEPGAGKETEVGYDDGTISFSLSNPKFGKYFVEGDVSKSLKNNNVNYASNVSNNNNNNNNNNNTEKTKHTNLTSDENIKNVNSNGANENLEIVTSGQQVFDVIIVNGHLENRDNKVSDNVDQDVSVTGIHAVDKSQDKPKARVTFSFADADTPRGRYTPIKGDVRVQLQSVLKKRRTPSPVLQRSASEDRASSLKKRGKIVNKESIRLFGSSYTLDYRFGYQNNGVMEQGIPVKNVHTTSTDLEKRHSKQTTSSSTNTADKPPVPSSANRITLSMAERAATNGSVRGMPNRDSRLSASHMRGRMAYFRPAEKARQNSNQTTRSRSSDDLHSLHNRSNNYPNSSTGKNNKNSTAIPFTLRRCASTERDIQLADNTISRNHRPKPKVAFGSFILPKETATRIKPAQVQFHELNASQGNLTLGTYVHSHTRRSPYAPPTQVLLSDNRKQDVTSRRQGTGHTQTRYLHQQHQQHHRQQQQATQHQRQAVQPNRNHSQRHSAPSSFGNVKDKSFATSQHDRISINNSPTKPQYPRLPASTSDMAPSTHKTHDVTSSSTKHNQSSKDNGGQAIKHDQVRCNRSGTNTDVSNRKANIAQLNSMATRERGASHHRFMSKLEAYASGGS